MGSDTSVVCIYMAMAWDIVQLCFLRFLAVCNEPTSLMDGFIYPVPFALLPIWNPPDAEYDPFQPIVPVETLTLWVGGEENLRPAWAGP